jgi:hypothetical protein
VIINIKIQALLLVKTDKENITIMSSDVGITEGRKLEVIQYKRLLVLCVRLTKNKLKANR